MSHLRAVARIVALLVFTIAVYGAIRAGILAHRLRGDARLHYFVERYQRWCRGVAKLMGMRIRSHGALPRAPYLLVTNHVSYTDIIALGALIAPVFVAKSEIAGWPLLGLLVRDAGTVFVDRDRIRRLPLVIGDVERRCGSGFGIAFFPEGTTGEGREVARFMPSLLEVAVRSRRGVTPAALFYRTPPGAPPAREAVAWTGTATLVPHLYRLLRLPRFDVLVDFSDRELLEDDRKRLAEMSRQEVARLLEDAAARSPSEGDPGA
jgi:1-acyl-sn-glycerol-3-phosphate acyltransferase